MELLEGTGAIKREIGRTLAANRCGLDAAALGQAVIETQWAIDQLRALQALLLVEADAAGSWHGSGARDVAGWLADQTSSSLGEAKSQVQLGDLLSEVPELTEAITGGELSVASLQAAQPTIHDPDLPTAQTARDLLPQLCGVGPREARRRAEEHARRQRSDDAEEARRAARHRRRSLRFHSVGDGMTEGRFLLPDGDAQIIRNAVRDIAGEPSEHDDRSPEQRAADALVALADAYAQGSITGGLAKPVVVFLHEADGTVTTSHGHPATSSECAQACCDGEVVDVVVDEMGDPLRVGRSTRTVSRRQRTALLVRDRRCRWPGCTMQPGWCDAHHIVEWEHGGHTDLDNLVLLCRHHHTCTHLPGTTMTGHGRRLAITLPNGQVLTSRPPAPARPPAPGRPPVPDRPASPAQPARAATCVESDGASDTLFEVAS